MKKILLSATLLLTAIIVNAQSLEDIIGRYTEANRLDKISKHTTIRISARTSIMGMEMPMEMWMKKPDKFKSKTSFNGTDIIQVFDGRKGYMLNPMAGSSEPVEMSSEQIGEILRNNLFNNYMANYLAEGKLTLTGEESVNGKPSYKIRADLGNGIAAVMFIDKSSYLLAKTVADVNQGGMSMTVESYPSDYTEINGLLFPMKTTTSAGGMDIVTTFTRVEVDVPMEDDVFTIR